MPYDGFYNEINSNFTLDKSWIENGKHYSKTLYAWLENLDNNYSKLVNLTYSNNKLLNRWKLFFIICGELFAYNDSQDEADAVRPDGEKDEMIELTKYIAKCLYLVLYLVSLNLSKQVERKRSI